MKTRCITNPFKKFECEAKESDKFGEMWSLTIMKIKLEY
jgi:hypothetical protein